MIDYKKLNSFIGIPWEYGNNDCWAIFKRSSKSLFNNEIVEIEVPIEEDLTKTISIFENATKSKKWQRIEVPVPGCAVLFRNKREHPVHIGLYIEKDFVLHSAGKTHTSTCDLLSDIIKNYKFSACEYYQYAQNYINQ